MKSIAALRNAVFCTATAVGMLVQPCIVTGAETTAPRVVARDVAASSDGRLTITLVDSAGRGLENVAVELRNPDGSTTRSLTNAEGVAVFSGVRAGVHTLHAGAGMEVVRIWSEQTAPPAAVRNLAIVSDAEVVRGQMQPPGGYVDPNGPPINFGGDLITPLTFGALALGIVTLVTVEENEEDLKTANARLQAQINALTASP